MKNIEYRVIPVTRYLVTRWEQETDEQGRDSGGSECCGEFDGHERADKVAQALSRSEAEGKVMLRLSNLKSERVIVRE
jgi:hypothetical protein